MSSTDNFTFKRDLDENGETTVYLWNEVGVCEENKFINATVNVDGVSKVVV